jgi:hypothetical protein
MPETQESVSAQLPKLPHIDKTEPLNAEDHECIREIRDVLIKHGRLNRFGLSLLHEHFDVASDECMVEVCDPETRTLTIRPVKRSNLAGRNTIETNWRLDSGEALFSCVAHCFARIVGGYPIHLIGHAVDPFDTSSAEG